MDIVQSDASRSATGFDVEQLPGCNHLTEKNYLKEYTLFFFFIRIQFFLPRLNILIFLPILG